MNKSDFRHFFPVDVRWGDADALGHINNVQFVRYLESARVAYCDDVMGIQFKPGIDVGWILAEMQCSYLRQVHYPSSLDACTAITRLGNKSATISAYIYLNGDTSPVLTSQGVMVWFDYKQQKTASIPDLLRDKITGYEKTRIQTILSNVK